MKGGEKEREEPCTGKREGKAESIAGEERGRSLVLERGKGREDPGVGGGKGKGEVMYWARGREGRIYCWGKEGRSLVLEKGKGREEPGAGGRLGRS